MAFVAILLLFSSCAHATGHHKYIKTPVATKAQNKSGYKRKKSASGQAGGSSSASLTSQYRAPVGKNPFGSSEPKGAAPMLTAQEKSKIQSARHIVISKLMNQLGKPYRYGGMSPITGFDCSGLVNYAYRDKLKSTLPRTANSMYHMSSSQAKRVDRGELRVGDLVFFRTHGRSNQHADHVGVYLGDGEFIQAPRTGKDIQISRLDDDYWQDHYIGARRVLLAYAVR
ncbi:C40 family peptidase [Leminorella grimontii]|uniref:C40 family peptidase n=1 Tax=Leminorella grimontii TaxID=82981 RepID=UPI00208AA633|nr:C40 family peptidase [Leminorella grimontii]GKX60784.1 hypothetical protein SOASR031_30990 [Leminorella grimontii]